jgi:uncharacterized protein (DUF983 family)
MNVTIMRQGSDFHRFLHSSDACGEADCRAAWELLAERSCWAYRKTLDCNIWKRLNAMAYDTNWAPISPYTTGIRGRCPRCGQGHMFNGFLTLRTRCEVCDLDYSFADPADGPAFFVICFACVPSVALAVWIEVAFQPPFWVHMLISLPFLLATCILPLRPLKGWLVASQYFYKAEQGKLDKAERPTPQTNETRGG